MTSNHGRVLCHRVLVNQQQALVDVSGCIETSRDKSFLCKQKVV